MNLLNIHDAFPKNLTTDVQVVISVLPAEISTSSSENVQEVLLEGEKLVIPARSERKFSKG
jgi:hypothetical protein